MSDAYAIATRDSAPEFGRRGAARAYLGLGALAAMLGAASVLAIDAAAHNSFLLPDPGHAHRFPDWLAGPLVGVGAPPTAARFMLLLLALCGGYAVVLVCAAAIPRRVAVAAIVALHVVFLLGPPLLSTDVFSYIDYARLAVRHGLDPYAAAPIDVAHDPVYRYVGSDWVRTTSVYGPLFTLASLPVALLNVAQALWAMKAVACAASLATVALVGRSARALRRPEVPAMLFIGTNPLLVTYTVGGGHNDLLMMLLLAAGVWLLVSERSGRAGAACAAAAAIKVSAGVVLPFLVVGARERMRAASGVVVALGATMAVGVAAFGTHLFSLFSVLDRHERDLLSAESVPNELARLFGAKAARGDVRTAAALVGLACFAALLIVAARGALHWISAAGWALVALVAATTWVQAWYVCWPLPFAALSQDRRLRAAALALVAVFLAHRLPFLLA
jgi:Glycosyltransferase family 87